MQEIIGRILEGDFDYENGSLDFSCAKLELTLQKGEDLEGSFLVYSESGQYTEGEVVTSDLRMECLTPHFVGDSAEISYCFHGEYMEEGDVVKGNFCIISNRGEYYLPFVVTVEYGVLESSIGSIKNLFHFANLAKSNWDEAVKLFYAPEFVRVLEGGDSQFYDCYRGLSVYPDNEQNVEEFLIRINKKSKVDYIVQEETLKLNLTTVDHTYSVAETELNIVRNGWGYTVLQVECEGDFLFTEKEILTDDDFLGNRCRLPVFVDTSLARNGKNFGRIFLYNSYVSLTIPVVVQVGEGMVFHQTRVANKKDTVRLMQLYKSFRLKKMGMAAWLKETKSLVEQMVSLDLRNVAARLYQAQILISEERYNEANWVLGQAGELMEECVGPDEALEAYYLYLTTLIRKEENYIDQVTTRVEQIYRRGRGNWRVAWLLLYLSEEYNRSAAEKWTFLEKQFNLGCTSPVLYIEALNLLNANPAVLRKADLYSLQVLHFGVRNKALKLDVLEQVLYLSGKVKEFSPLLLKILIGIYEENQDVRVLQEICALLIKGNRIGQEYFSWYQAGVEANLRITSLYEYYMMSVDLEVTQTIPKTVLLYFSYQSSLDYERRAFLYCYVMQNKEALGELYGTYRTRIELFVIEQVQKGRINRNLAKLYREYITPELIDEKLAGYLAKLMFAHQVQVDDLRMQKVIVYHADCLQPAEYVLRDGIAWVAIYGNDYTILLEDAYGNRFLRSVEFTLEKLMIPGKNLHRIAELVDDCIEMDLFLCEGEKETEGLSEENVRRVGRVANSGGVDGLLRRKLYLKLLRRFYDTDNMRELDNLLEKIRGEEFSMEERAEVLRFLILRNKVDSAWDMVKQFGPYFVEQKTLMRLVSEMIGRMDGYEDAYLVTAAHSSFKRGKYDGRLLQYLVDYLNGPLKDLRDVWKSARSFDLDCYRLSERMLVQMMYTGGFVGEKMEIFKYYVANGANVEVEEAFLMQCSYDYFVRERLTDSVVFEEIGRMSHCGGNVQKVCKLAYLKYFAENAEEITPDMIPLIGDFLHEMMDERIHLNFFRNFEGVEFPQGYLLREMMDKTIVEYCARPGARARIHYIVSRENEGDTEYLTEPMREIFGGVCFKEFVLFFGENLQYYIVEEENGEEQLTESGSLQRNDAGSGNASWSYELINDIAISRTLQDFDTMDKLLEEYCHREFLFRELFSLR